MDDKTAITVRFYVLDIGWKMKRIFILAIILTIFIATYPASGTGAPEPASYDCQDWAWLGMIWFDPPPGIGAMSPNGGVIYVTSPPTIYEIYQLYYDGYIIYDGKIVHNWHTVYEKPDDPYTINGYVVSAAGGAFWFNEFRPPCQMVYLPVVKR